MPDLSACYFCGAAADAQVREYDVVPDAADETLRSTATLCPGCREKLETVLSPVVRGARPSDEPVDVNLAPADGGDDADAAASTPSLDVRAEDILAAADRSSDESDDEAAATGEDSAAIDEDSASDDADADAADAAATSSDAADDSASDGETDAADPLAGPGGDSATDGIAFGDDADAAASSGGDTEPETEPAADVQANGEPSSATSSPDTPSGDVERPDADTYNRVVRLLQNREFPVNRSEFSELASSAYDIPADECARVIDYAIHRGELVEDRGMLKKP